MKIFFLIETKHFLLSIFFDFQFEQRRQQLIQSAQSRDVYLNECKLFEDSYNLTAERFNRSVAMGATSEQYAQQILEEKLHYNQLDEKYRQLNLLYDRLDPDTRNRYNRQHQQIDKRANDLRDQFVEQTIRREYNLRMWREYELRLNQIRREIEQIQKELPLSKRLVHFEQIQAAFVLFKVRFVRNSFSPICLFVFFKDLNQRLTTIEPENYHLTDEIDHFSQHLNILSLQTEATNVKENFLRLIADVRDRFDRFPSEEEKRFCSSTDIFFFKSQICVDSCQRH